MKRGLVIISGATGFIGRPLALDLAEAGYEVAVLTRNPQKASALFGNRVRPARWDGRTSEGWRELASRALGIVNLAGENIGAGRWTDKKKQEIVRSRIDAGRAVMDAFQKVSARPRILIQASAVGYYGPRGDEEVDESSPAGEGFLAAMTRDWESSTSGAAAFGVRCVVVRSGLVLDREGGVLPRFLRQFRFFAGGPLGHGKQWLSWIHRRDEVAAIRFLLEREDLAGVFNLTAPGPLTMKGFARTLGWVMKRPAWFPVPAFLLRLLFGQMAEETLLAGQKVLPRALLKAGFRFSYPDLKNALLEILR
ncbi:MAG: TIGR01777 family protein [Candidatus Aminicenantes bacterium RBG_19FT_COMBO_58_17]|nr:MAG: TIGR01777 family protein [Candidatus Aminicenantes bacterium RBG_19FT_COMBO_58_17]HCS48230.1 TIGR01777 family protein [Candidatus Aminicenantes bacterium]